MGTAGHVDHGKTSLIKALTQIDCDTHEEEKRRGITINLGFSYLLLSTGETVGIIDVPGHKDFINTMIAGACGIDFVLIVISADSGIMPQTIEHIRVISLLGIKKAIVALAKIDLVDNDLAEIAKSEIRGYLANTPYKNAPIVGVSSTKNIGIGELITEIENLCSNIEERKKGTFFRMYIDRIFSVKGMGSVVTGSVLNGEINIGDELMLLPGKISGLKIRSIERHGKKVNKVKAGDRAAINLPDVKKEDVHHGVILSDKQIEETCMIDVSVSFFEPEKEKHVWSTLQFLTGTFQSQARMHMLSKDNDSGSSVVFAQIHLQKPAILIRNDKFIIRNSSGNQTIGGGFVIDSSPLHHRKVTVTLLENLTKLANSLSDNLKITELIQQELKKEMGPLSVDEIAGKFHISIKDVVNETKNCNNKTIRYENEKGLIFIHHENDMYFQNKILSILNEYHKVNSLFAEGLKSNELLGKTGLLINSLNENYLSMLLNKMQSNSMIKQVKNTWAKAEHYPQVDEKTKKQLQWLENEILKYDLQKPVITEIEEKSLRLGISNGLLRVLLAFLVRERKIYMFNAEVIHKQVVDVHKKILLTELLKKEKEGLDSEEFRKQTGLSKRLCPILLSIYEKEKLIKLQNLGYKSLLFISKEGQDYR